MFRTADSLESSRRREVLIYGSALIADSLRVDDPSSFHSNGRPLPRASSDPALTAFAQLAVSTLGASRALISLFHDGFQHIVAEATPSVALDPSSHDPALWLCGTAIPRPYGICGQALDAITSHAPEASSETLPLMVIPDLLHHEFSRDMPYCHAWPNNRFYCGVPIRTASRIDVGFFCVFDVNPRDALDPTSEGLMRSLSKTIMAHLELKRSFDDHRRAAGMIRAVGSFVGTEAELAMSATAATPVATPAANTPGFNPPSLDYFGYFPGPKDSTPQGATPGRGTPSSLRALPQTTDQTPSPDFRAASCDDTLPRLRPTKWPPPFDRVFREAASVIRGSLEVDGVIFLDATVESFGGLVSDAASTKPEAVVKDTPLPASQETAESLPTPGSSMAESEHQRDSSKTLDQLVRRYPSGKIFTFNADGSYSSALHQAPGASSQSILQDPLMAKLVSEEADADFIQQMLPGARGVAFMPLWDTSKQRWHAMAFAHTNDSSRILTDECELNYLATFAAIIMSKVDRLRAKAVGKSSSDLLGALSHDLRSPLHGVMMGSELLRDDASLDASQLDIVHLVETCSRTLLDTIDHLLDWSQINNFNRASATGRRGLAPPSEEDATEHGVAVEDGMISIASDVDIVALAEEVVESVTIGHDWRQRSNEESPRRHSKTPSAAQAHDNTDLGESTEPDLPEHGGVITTLDFDPDPTWVFHTQPGSIRRIIMNIFGNSLNYTTRGFIKVSLRQESLPGSLPGSRLVVLTVADSGCGIDPVFLANGVYDAFSQEDVFSPGAGLGLSIVRHVVRKLGGWIDIQSKVGVGTEVTVKLPLQATRLGFRPPIGIETPVFVDPFESHVNELRGRSVVLAGPFGDLEHLEGVRTHEEDVLSTACGRWLNMAVTHRLATADLGPEPILCDEQTFTSTLAEKLGSHPAPIIVICKDQFTAHQLARSPSLASRYKSSMLEFVSRPVGPRKLARMLSRNIRRWSILETARLPREASPADDLAVELSDKLAISETDGAPVDDMVAAAPAAAQAVTITTTATNPTPTPPKLMESIPPSDLSQEPSTLDAIIVTSPPAGPYLLLVDDNAINLKVLSAHIRKLQLPYVTATDGFHAVATFKELAGRITHVFMDISMPIMDGFEATRQIRAAEDEAGRPERCRVFALTGLASTEAQREAFASGIDLFLTKPVQGAELSRVLGRAGVPLAEPFLTNTIAF